MKLHLDNYPKFISFEKEDILFLTKQDLIRLFSNLDKDRQIESLINKLEIKDSDISIISSGYSKDVYFFWKKVWFFIFTEWDDYLKLLSFCTSNMIFSDYEFKDIDKWTYNLAPINIPFLWHAILYHIVLFAKWCWKNVLDLISSNYAYRKGFYDDAFDYFKRRNIIKLPLNYGRKYLVKL